MNVMSTPPFADFAASLRPQPPLRSAITAATRRPETACLPPLIEAARLTPDEAAATQALAVRLVTALRAKGTRGTVEGLVREYDLSSQEGIALMCLAEALLRIPDRATRDALIRDKVGSRDWRAHVGHSPSLFVNAATWGLVVTGKLTGTANETGLAQALTRLIARSGEPVIRRGLDMAMRMMGEQFVTGETIEEALGRARRLEAMGFRYSYDMLGEAATTAADAERYHRSYEDAIGAIGRASAGRGAIAGPGISVKLSALHPRYARQQRDRVMAELLPRLQALAKRAAGYGIGLNIDAEESERLDLSLDLLEALCRDPAFTGWDGIGFVVQAYGKRAPFVLDWIVGLARDSGHRVMVRLVKGAYWDSEIKRAQVDGLEGFPVYTRKLHTDVAYLACARTMLAAPDAIFPQFATHNAHTVAAIHSMAGGAYEPGQYEFQCLHGMGEPLYEEVVGHNKLNRPCRIYAPVGTHETLLAYLVRRLLENGANSSFVNRIADPAVPIADLVADPVAAVAARLPVGAGHERIALPRDLFRPSRANAAGLDLSSEATLSGLAAVLTEPQNWLAGPAEGGTPPREIRNPADHDDIVGTVRDADPAAVESALARAAACAPSWRDTAPAERAAALLRAADQLEAQMPRLMGLIIREAGKSFANAVAEVREAVDFLRYYGATVRDGFDNRTHVPLGPVCCISPWNFPLAIFTGQVAAALAAGNPVLAKPAEETPLTAAAAVRILHAAGIPADALHLLPGAREVGAALVADPRVCGVMFTGSTAVAKTIARQLAQRLNPDGAPVPLIAETGGQNAMVVDSSALAEQVVADVLTSAFDSAGQRCSALRLLCVQEEVADRVLDMVRGAMDELRTGDPQHLHTDIGPVITAEARDGILAHVAAMRASGRPIYEAALAPECARGTFVAPTLIEIGSVAELEREVFGPVLHVLRYRREALDEVMAAVNATGYGLTFGLHTRIDETIERVVAQAGAGNIYVNRNVIGAVVGVQPFGGHGLSGTGPKAGGPLYLRRLLRRAPPVDIHPGRDTELPGPVGERNLYRVEPRGTVLCLAGDPESRRAQVQAAEGTGNHPVTLAAETGHPDAVLFAGSPSALQAVCAEMAAKEGPIVPVFIAEDGHYRRDNLVRERVISINTTAAGGNASLMTIG
jgi:RHH-type proline utilization regulon transcriptional repressor/proline dehydrogenase/delta 1-pyrroline-5-carboxylate dehydrogenase